jgi:hypothetical protein
MRKRLAFNSILALCAAAQLGFQAELANAASLTYLTTVPDSFSEPLVVPERSINSPALYNVTQFYGNDVEELDNGLNTIETSGPGSINYTPFFELGDGVLSFTPGESPPAGLLYPHYLVISYFIPDEENGDGDDEEGDFEEEFEFTTFEVDEPPAQFLGALYEIAGCNPGPCTINLMETLLGDEERIPNFLSISVYNSAVIPLPPAALLFGSALAAVLVGARRRKAKV